jgi:hypothetical protein
MPMSIMVGIGRGLQSGVLIKNAEALERMENVDTLVLDKTGAGLHPQPGAKRTQVPPTPTVANDPKRTALRPPSNVSVHTVRYASKCL